MSKNSSRLKDVHVQFNIEYLRVLLFQLLKSPDFIENYGDMTLEQKQKIDINSKKMFDKVLSDEFDFIENNKKKNQSYSDFLSKNGKMLERFRKDELSKEVAKFL